MTVWRLSRFDLPRSKEAVERKNEQIFFFFFSLSLSHPPPKSIIIVRQEANLFLGVIVVQSAVKDLRLHGRDAVKKPSIERMETRPDKV